MLFGWETLSKKNSHISTNSFVMIRISCVVFRERNEKWECEDFELICYKGKGTFFSYFSE